MVGNKSAFTLNVVPHQDYVSMLISGVGAKRDGGILSPLSLHIIIADQAANLIVNLVALEAEDKVL